MSDNITKLQIAESPTKKAVVELLEEVLADAKAGRILSISAVVTRPEGVWSSLAAGIDSSLMLLGMLEQAKIDAIAATWKGFGPPQAT